MGKPCKPKPKPKSWSAWFFVKHRPIALSLGFNVVPIEWMTREQFAEKYPNAG